MSLFAPGSSWQEVAQAMQKHRDESIAAVSPPIPNVPDELPFNVSGLPKQLLSDEEVSITESPVENIVSAMANGSLSSTTVVSAFLRRAGVAQKLANCVTEVLPARALERAKYLDDYLTKHGKPIGPLHGLPISVKEHIGMKDLNLNGGYISWCDRTSPDDALILKLLWKAGAVFYARTTQPQTLMHLETSSNLYGETVNPFNRRLTSGGSSGGEGALVGLRGSCLGIGTDIGGSIRSPAANNGVFGLRPTSFRLPLNGCAVPMMGADSIMGVIGPLSTSLGGIKLFMKSLLDQQPWLYEPSLMPLPWRADDATSLLRPSGSSTTSRKLKIGVLADDGVVKPHPPIQRAMERLTKALSTNPDIELVPFPPYKHDEAWRIISSLYFTDGGADEAATIDASKEPWRPLSRFILSENPNVKSCTVPELWELHVQREVYRGEYAAHWNSVSGSIEGGDLVDVVLCPVSPGAAPPLDCARYWGYTSQWNLLDYPALAFPTGLHVEPSVDVKVEGYVPRNKDDEYNYKLYESQTYQDDAPISLQLVGRRYEDEKLIAAMEMITQISGLPFPS